MKRFFWILSLSFSYFLFSADSCNQGEQNRAGQEQQRIDAAKDSIEAGFGANMISSDVLLDFERNATIRFYDFLDYCKIISDSSLASVFIDQTRIAINRNFISDRCSFRFERSADKINKSITLNQLISSKSNYLNLMASLNPDSLWVSDHLKLINDSIYSGRIGFRVSPDQKKKSSSNISGSIDFFVVKHKKNFGKEILKIWTVFLGDSKITE